MTDGHHGAGSAETGLGQALRNFTVQIRDQVTQEVAGAGFLVGDRKIVTCAHVLEEAGVDPITGKRRHKGLFGELFQSKTDGPGLVTVELVGSMTAAWTGVASLIHRFASSDDDIVMLVISEDDNPPPRPLSTALLGRAVLGERHSFLSYGFPRLGSYEGHRVFGVIGAAVPAPSLKLHAERIQVHPQVPVRPGMSGAPVLDEELNLVVGVLVESTVGDHALGPGDAWAVDARVLNLAPFDLPVLAQRLPRRKPPLPEFDADAVSLAALEVPGSYHNQEARLQHETPRSDLLESLISTTHEPDRRLLSIVGFGGQGKTTLARAWERAGLDDTERSCMFWWTFDQPDVDAFFEAAFNHLTRGRVNLGDEATTAQRVQLLTAIMRVRRYIIVLDGLEAVQKTSGPDRGTIANRDLADFLRYTAAGEHQSFCLLTSRLPVLDLLDAPSWAYREWYAQPMSTDEGRRLLQSLGVRGARHDLDALVTAWMGHPLSLALLGGIIRERCDGQAARGLEFALPLKEPGLNERLGSLLDFYDQTLTDAEQALLTFVSAHRGPARLEDLDAITGQDATETRTVNALRHLTNPELMVVITRLEDLALLTRSADERNFAMHPLLRREYQSRLQAMDPDEEVALHSLLYRDCLRRAEVIKEGANLAELSPLLDAVYHGCVAGYYQEALSLYRRKVEGDSKHLSYQLNAYSTVLSLMETLMAGVDEGVLIGKDARYILNRKGVALMNTGRLAEAVDNFRSAIAMGMRSGDVLGAAQSSENLAEVNLYLGHIDASLSAARRAVRLAGKIPEPETKDEELRDCYCYVGWAASLAGRKTEAARSFADAEALQLRIHPDQPILLDIWGIAHADFLRYVGQIDKARTIAEFNLTSSEENGLLDNRSICHRLIGELDASTGPGAWPAARQHLGQAVEIARSISERTVLAEALTARGRAEAEFGNVTKAAADLEEALQYAEGGGYELLRVDAQLGLATRLIRMGESENAASLLEEVRTRAQGLGYGRACDEAQLLYHKLEPAP